MESEGRKIEKRFHKDEERFREESAGKGAPFPDIDGVFVPFDEIAQQFKVYQRIELAELNLRKEAVPGKTTEAVEALKTIEIRGHFQLEVDLEVRLAKKGSYPWPHLPTESHRGSRPGQGS